MLDHLAAHRKVRVLIDTCSFMHPQAEVFCARQLEPMIKTSGIPAVVPKGVADEIEKHRLSPNPTVRSAAAQAAALLKHYRIKKIMGVFGEVGDPFVDNIFQVILLKHRLEADFLLITQDRGLAADCLRLNFLKSVKTSYRIYVARIGNDGRPEEWAIQGAGVQIMHRKKAPAGKIPDDEKFTLRSGAVTVNDALLPLSRPPVPGHWLCDQDHQRVILGRPVAPPGGEGTVHETDRGLVCKIYRPERLKAGTLAKLRLMVSKPIAHASICWPRALVFNQQNEFVGYLMNRAGGRSLERVLGEKSLATAFPHWNRTHLATLALSILEAIQFLHERNVLLGDINLNNFLIEDEQRISLVDVDSYQVEGFACGVGFPPFVPPELLGQKLSEILRTRENEYFAVATLVFMILMPGQSPYAHQGGGTPAENVKKGHFPYSRNKDHPGKGAPKGRWTNIWSHFPRPLKETFHRVFTDRERLPASAWLGMVTVYRDYMANLSSCPPESRVIWPEQVKSIAPRPGEGQTCRKCGETFAPFQDQCLGQHPPLCLGCHEAPTAVQCVFDEVVFSMPFARTLQQKFAICPQCSHKPPVVKQCRDCGEPFSMGVGEQAYFKFHGYSFPARCKECRERKRAQA